MATNKFFGRSTELIKDVKVDVLDNDLLRHAFECYKAAPQDGAIPTLRDFLAQDIAKIFGYICVVRSEEGKFYYEVVGRNLENLYGKKISGLSIEQAYKGDIVEEVNGQYSLCKKRQKPIYGRTSWKLLFRNIGFYKLIMPVLDTDTGKTKFVSCITPTDLKIKTESDWKFAEDVQAFQKINEMSDMDLR